MKFLTNSSLKDSRGRVAVVGRKDFADHGGRQRRRRAGGCHAEV